MNDQHGPGSPRTKLHRLQQALPAGWLLRLKVLTQPSIGRRLAILILAFSFVVTLLSTVFQLTLEYRRDVNDLKIQLGQIEVSYHHSLASSLWVTSAKDLALQLEGILQLPDMQYLEVRSETGAVVARAGVDRERQVIERVMVLNYTHLDKMYQLGSLRMVVNLDGVYHRLIDKIWVILVSQGIKTFLVSFFILFLFQVLVGRYLRRIADYSSQISPAQMDQPLTLERPVPDTQVADELDQVVCSINEMRQNLRNYIQSLAKSEEHLAVTLDSIGDAVITTNDEGRVTGMNPTAQHLTGWSKAEAVGRPLEEVFPILNSQSRQAVPSPVQQVLEQGRIVGLANGTALISRDGTEYQIADSAAPIKDKTGRIYGVVLVFHDVTEAYRVQQAVQQFKHTLDQTRDSVLMFNADDFLIFYANKSTRDLLGYSEDELLHMRLSDLNPRATPEQFMEAIKPLLVGSQPVVSMRTIRRHKDGHILHVDVSIQLVRPEHQRAHFVSIARDVSDKIQAEAEQRIAATAFQAQEGMAIADTANLILRVNQAFTEITGYGEEDIVGRTLKLLDSGRHDDAFFTQMQEDLITRGAWAGEMWCRRKSGEIYPEWHTIRVVKDSSGVATHFVHTHTDITQRKQAEAEISHLAFYDTLTQLPNRRLLIERLGHELASGARSQRHGALVFLDLDNFKTLNDTQGHDLGDQLLKEVARRLQSSVRQGDTVARLGGDEFVVMLEDLGQGESALNQAEAVALKIQAALNHPYELARVNGTQQPSTLQYRITSSLGIALYSGGEDTVDELLKRADLAMYQAKSAGRNTIRFFDPQMQVLLLARTALEESMRHGLQNQEFLLYYQPQVNDQDELVGAEALVRWKHPIRGMVSPAEFIPLAEESGLILPLGRWVMEEACRQLVAWEAEPSRAHLTLAVNVSARQFKQQDFVDQVLEVLKRTGAYPMRLKLELTESMLLDDVEDIIEKMTLLRLVGVSFSLDDFGTGYSSLSYLKRLPLDQLKIDASFVRDVLTDKDDASIVRAIVVLGQSLGMSVIAEGVETEAQREFLAQNGCSNYQGYFFGRPAAAESLRT